MALDRVGLMFILCLVEVTRRNFNFKNKFKGGE